MSSGLLKTPSSWHKYRINPDVPKVLTYLSRSLVQIYKQWGYHYVALLWLHSDIGLIMAFVRLFCFVFGHEFEGREKSPQYLKQIFLMFIVKEVPLCNTFSKPASTKLY